MRPGFLVTALAALLATSAWAQSSGGLKIRVIDNADKAPIIGASVTISNANRLVATTTLVADRNGVALFPVLRSGSGYVVTVIMDGYAGIRQETSVGTDALKELVIAMVPEHVERVTIVDEKIPVDLDQNEASTRFTAEFIQDLPVAGRFYQNVLALAPGVQDPDHDGNPNVNGARERDFKTSVAGISNVDPLTGQYLNIINPDSIEDLNVVTAGAGAEFSRAQGGFAQIVQKQGSNDFEGVFGFLYSSHLLDGSGSTGISQKFLPDFYLYQPSIQISGPILRDKLWYRLSQEYIARQDPVVLATGGTIQTQGVEQVSSDNQITWQVSNRNKLSFNFRTDPKTQTHVGISSLETVDSTEEFRFGGPTYTLTWTAPYSPSLLIDSTVAYQNTHLDITPTATGVPNNCGTPAWLQYAQCFNVDNGTTSGSSPRDWADVRQRLTVRSDATYFLGKKWGATHQIKFGLSIENERYSRTLDRGPTFLQTSVYNPFAHKAVVNYAITTAVTPGTVQTSTGTTWGIYGEDILRPIANVSITVGARIENEQIHAQGYQPFDPQAEQDAFLAAAGNRPASEIVALLQQSFTTYEDVTGAMGDVAVQFPGATFQGSGYTSQLAFWQKFRRPSDIDLNNVNVAPRFAIAWDPWNDGKTKFSASAGRYFDKIFLAIPAAEAEPVLVTFNTGVDPTVPFDPTFSYSTVDRNLKTPYQDEWSVAVEREVWQESTLSLRYIHRSFKNQLQDVDINQAPNDYGKCRIPPGVGLSSLVPSPGVGPVVDPYTGQTYMDTDPGIGDGRLDDCTGRQENFPGAFGPGAPTFSRGDGFADLYILDPGWGNIFKIGNYNQSQYDGVTLEFVRRQYKNWQMEASYTLSKATGNGEDYNLILGNDQSTLHDEAGYQSYDVRHSFKLNATTIIPGGFRLGGSMQYQSGLPYSLLYRDLSATTGSPRVPILHTFYGVRTVYPTHQRNDQRNVGAWNFDTKITKELTLAKGMNLQLTGEIFNLLGENTYTIYNSYTKSGQQINGTNDAYRRFGRQYQVGMRLAF
ncbi:MAG TPA: hypothetical protein VFV19_07380 [Candidatus Polarisedimenticolaceae bacterium]|nr:hypothetical protein [Candidatus Polarisedimenticolaceae bacterium]